MGRINKLPGIDTEKNTTRRNVLIGGGYAFVGLAAVGTLVDPEDEEAEDENGDGADDDDTEPSGNGQETAPEEDDDTDVGGEDDGAGDQDETDQDEDDQDEADDEDEPAEPSYGTSDTYSFSGRGADVEPGLDLDGGLVVVEASHDGSSNFTVHLVGPDRDHLFVNEIGRYDGETADDLEFGEYALDVEADGSWEVEVRTPWVERGYDLPVDESGTGATLLGPYEFEGVQTLTATHDGSSNFIVQVLPEIGWGELVVNEIGSYDGSSTVRFDEPGWIAVEADGDWTIEVQ